MKNILGENSGLGGKAESLIKLESRSLAVPSFFVITDSHFQRMISKISSFSDFQSAFQTSQSDLLLKAARLRQDILKLRIDEDLEAEIYENLKHLGEDKFFSVRSSALGEDSAGQSFAGQMDSFLFCRGLDDILVALRKCWASLFSDRAISYRQMSSLEGLSFGMGVIVQEMIEGEVSGVCFSVNPLNSDPNELLVHATWGLGEGIVSGALDADQFVCARDQAKILNQEVVEKTKEVIFDRTNGKGTIESQVEEKRSKAHCLMSKEVLELRRLALQIEDIYQFPQDIEWTLAKGKIYILQSRPITTLRDSWRFTPVGKEELQSYETIWDNSNIVESYSGVTTPLTFSFAKHCYHIVYVQFCEILGVPKRKILDYDFAFQNMLGLIRGRIYYNLKNWYRLISVLPGYQYNKEFMEQMMGVKESTDFLSSSSKASFFQRYFIDLPRLLGAGLRLSYRFLRLDRDVSHFTKIVTETFERYRKVDFSRMSLHSIVDSYFQIENRVLRNWKPPIVNDFMAMIFYGLLQKILKSWQIDETGSLQNELLSAQGDVESTLPIKELQRIAKFIRNDPKLLKTFNDHDSLYLKTSILNTPITALSSPEKLLRSKIENYLDLYGFRCMNELKLEESSLQENPEFVFKILKNYAGSATEPLELDESNESSRAAYEKVLSQLEGKRLFFVMPKAWVFKFVLSYAKKAVKVREYQRFARTKMFGLMRNLFNAIGVRLHALGELDQPKDIFYLTREEIFNYIVGASVITDIRELTQSRKKDFEKFRSESEPADRIRVRGAVYLRDFQDSSAEIAASDGGLKGTSCCPGIVKGPVKVILSPSDDMSLNGEILVAGRTDPGWVTLYPSASGLLIERGSVLSHSAIVARELGLPAIVGIPNITKILKTGDWVEMNGQTGCVTLLGVEEKNEVQRAAQ